MYEVLISISIGALIYWNLFFKNRSVMVSTIPEADRRIADEGIFLDVEKAHGKMYASTSNPEEYMRGHTTRKDAKGMSDVKEEFLRRQEQTTSFVKSYAFNQGNVMKRQQFSGPSNEIDYPRAQLGSNWYTKAAKGGPAYYSRIIPYS